MSEPKELITAFKNMRLYTQDHMITTMRPQLREGVLEAIKILEKEISRLKNENTQLEYKLGISKNTADNESDKRIPSSTAETYRRLVRVSQNASQERITPTVSNAEQSDDDVQEAPPKRAEQLVKPTGPIDIGRPYPVYVICYICGLRVLTKTVEKSAGGCCLSCLTETPPVTVLHSCPNCNTFLGLYYDRQDDF